MYNSSPNASFKLFHFSCINFIFHVIHEFLEAAMWLKKIGYQKKVIHKILDFHFF
jgi:hypothetical protein